MLSSEFETFAKQASVLCAGFNVPATDDRIEAYWRGLQRMDLPIFTRVVEFALGETGPEKIPTVPQLWNLQREMRRTRRAPVDNHRTTREFDKFHAFGQRCLRRYLTVAGPVADEILAKLIVEKNRIVGQFRVIAAEESVTPNEIRDSLLGAFARIGGVKVEV